MLERLRATGLRLGLISNCSIEEVAAWHDSPLAAFFDGVVFSYRTGAVKPDPATYLLACQRIEATAERTAFVGDGGSEELHGAARAGMTPFRARWFLDRWPSWRGDRDRANGCAELSDPSELLPALQRSPRYPLP